ncbi:MAG: hypothetical protein IKK75_10420 [Clostridia bacterium]|nr:hypothetical protein [Clostridia bacterium]
MSKPLRLLIVIGVSAVFVFLAVSGIVNQQNCDQMLRAVRLENAGLERVDYTYFRDFLQYADGYEIAVFRIDSSQWIAPDSWTRFEASRPVAEVAEELGIALNANSILDLSVGGEACQAYCFVDRREAESFDEREYYFAYCEEAYGKILVVIYRGHHLYGI